MKKHFLPLLLGLVLITGLLPSTALAASEPSVTASAAIVMDANSGEIYFEKNADAPRPIASMTKIMSMYLVLEAVANGVLGMDTPIAATPSSVAISSNPEFSGLEYLKLGQTYRTEDLIAAIMVASCNGSVVALAEHLAGTEAAFVAQMNQRALGWGLTAQFVDCTGITDEESGTTARSMAEMTRRLLTDYPEILRFTTLKTITFNGKIFNTTNRMLRERSYAGIDGLKSGTTDDAGPCYTATAQRGGRRIITVAMNCATNTARVSDTRRLLDYGFACQPLADQKRASNLEQALLAFSAGTSPIFPRSTHNITATFAGLDGGLVGRAQWEVNGAPLAGYVLPNFRAENNTTLTLPCPIAADATKLTVGLRLTLWDGAQLYREQSFETTAAPLTFSGHAGITAASLYPGSELRVQTLVTCNETSSCTIPAGWYLDGVALERFQNPAFTVSATSTSAYTFCVPADMASGEHTLEFICNPQNLPGITRTAFTTTLELLPLAA